MLHIMPFEYERGISEVIVYGGTIWGKNVYQQLKAHGVKVVAILDKYQCGEAYEDIVIQNPEEIKKYHNTPVIICATRGFRSMCDFVESAGYTEAYHAAVILNEVDWENIHEWDVYAKDEMIGKYMKYVGDYMGEGLDKIELGEFNVIVTDLCNLKCDQCLARCPDITNGKFHPMDELIGSFKKFLSPIHCLYKIIICGGEPLMHPELYKLIRFAIEQDKIKRIEVLTNATIIPQKENLKSMVNEKVRLVFDDYSLPQQKISELETLCENEGILYSVKKLEYWHDLTLMNDQNYTRDDLEQLYRECTESQNYTLVDNKIVNCYRTFVDRQCGDWPENIRDYYIDLHEYKMGDTALKDAFLELRSLKSIERCKYCVGTGKNARTIPVAEQRKRNSV